MSPAPGKKPDGQDSQTKKVEKKERGTGSRLLKRLQDNPERDSHPYSIFLRRKVLAKESTDQHVML